MRICATIFGLIFLAGFSCQEQHFAVAKKNFRTCDVLNPVEDIPWLGERIRAMEAMKATDTYPYFYISQGELNGQIVFVIENCCPFCNTARIAYNCDGVEVSKLQFDQEQEMQRWIWRPEGFECGV